MPTVSNQNILVVLPELARIIRGQSNSIALTLHQDYVGNQLNIGITDNVLIDVFNSENQLIYSASKLNSSLVYGAPNSDQQGAVQLAFTAEQTAALPFGDLAQGAIKCKITVVLGITEVKLPTLKLANVYSGGDQIGEVFASRFTLPGSVYKVKSLSILDKPAAGEIIVNDEDPSGITKIRVAITDDKGYRNAYLESVLSNRIDVDGVLVTLFLTEICSKIGLKSFYK